MDGDAALRAAASSMFGLEAAQLLLDRGANIRAYHDAALRDSALRDAALSDQRGDVVPCLLDRGADIHACKDQALVNARARRNDIAVQILLESGGDRSVLDYMERIMQVPRWPEDEDLDDESFLVWLATGEYPC
ncbi:hypothetical protein M427DRAFT_33357 [Gonapodya prolifera JEL478]|uniref:Uncharacterized protein n=1 Tax=Gonapodya prolifera (strain JEL478) TaxID=1344416 RepID=A0A139AC45_GONPJ|nr:hypothetical protein M427DRAFT_33357 [Gonapodya prolifera JEL478]|eukprot:KXS14164.1 hypothetical protein M427DRAFT_33357 [Gonapodya prolifera JEL478]